VRGRAPAVPEVPDPGELGGLRVPGSRTGAAVSRAFSSWLLLGWLERDVGFWGRAVHNEHASGKVPGGISKSGGGAQGLSVALAELKTPEDLVSLLGIYSSGCKKVVKYG